MLAPTSPSRPRTTSKDGIVPKRRTNRVSTTPTPIDPHDDEVAPLYLALLETSDPSLDSLRAQGFSTEELERLLPVLEERRMIQPVTSDTWTVVPPDIAMPAYAAQLEARARMVRTTAQAMSRVYLRARSARRTEATSDAVLLESVVDIAQALHQVTSGAQEWIVSSRVDSPLSRYLLQAPRPVTTTPFVGSHGAPLSVRLIIDPALLPVPNVLDIMHARVAIGDEVRLTNGLPFTGAVNDQGLAMIDLGDDGGSPVGILLDTAAGSGRVQAVLEFAWHLGTPWRPSSTPASTTDLLDPRDRNIVRLMAAGVSDVAIARQLGISSRTVERRVRMLMDRLNATTRFQAGVLAARQGLI